MLDFWFTENHTDDYKVSWRLNKVLYREQTPYQEIAIVEAPELGRALLLDNVVQTTTRFEFIYHEMIAHVPLMIHPQPERVLIIGGGDGGAAREILKHPSVKSVDLVEIDQRVIEVCRQWLPEISGALSSSKMNLFYTDGLKYIQEYHSHYDVVLVDCTDPSGPSLELFTRNFYQDVFKALKEDGLMVSQTGSPTFSSHFREAVRSMGKVFPLTRPYLTCEPSYIAGFWSFTVGSKKYDLANIDPDRMLNIHTKYYTLEIHQAAFVLPKYIEHLLYK